MYMYNPGSPFLRILEAYMAQSYMCTCTMIVVIGYMYMIVCINILFTPDVLRAPSFHPPHTSHVPPLTTHTSHVPPLITTHPHLTCSTPHHPPPPQVVLLDNSNGLLQYLPAPQVHKELGGSLVYNHDEWIDAQRVSNLLIRFCFTLIFLPLLKDVLSTCTRSFLYRPVS